MKVAVLCVGLGRVTRGFERFADDLGNHLKDHIDVEVFGSFGGKATTALHQIPSMSRDGILAKIPWTRRRPSRNPYYWECLTFLVSALPLLIGGRFDVIHVMDPPIVNFLYHLRHLPGLRTPVIFTNGIGMRDPACARASHLHEVSPVSYEQALTYVDANRVSLTPLATDGQRLRNSFPSKHQARRELGVKEDGFVVLSVTALNRSSKRSHYLIDEVAQVADATLLCVGRVEDPDLPGEGRIKLGSRFVNHTLPFDRISLAYAAADVFALASIEEGFALAVVEAMFAEVPVLVHANKHFEWLVQEQECLVDMTASGALAKKIEMLRREPAAEQQLITRREAAQQRFSWENLTPAYIDMYERLAGSSK